MTDEKDTKPDAPAPAPKAKSAAKKKAPVKAPKAAGYVVAGGRSIATGGRILVEGESITAEDVADIEALIKGGYVVKA